MAGIPTAWGTATASSSTTATISNVTLNTGDAIICTVVCNKTLTGVKWNSISLTLDVTGDSESGNTCYVFSLLNVTGATGNVVLTVSTSSSDDAIISAWQVPGLLTSSAFDKTHSGTNGSSTTPTSGATATTSQANEIAFGVTAGTSGAIGGHWLNAFTPGQSANISTTQSLSDAYKILSATQTVTAAKSGCASESYTTTVATYKYISAPTGLILDTVGSSTGSPETVNASPTSPYSVTNFNWEHIISTSSNAILFAGFGLSSKNGLDAQYTVTASLVSGQNMTLIGTVHSNNAAYGFVSLFGLIAPATGEQFVQVTVNWATTGVSADTIYLTGGSISFTGADQTLGWRNANTSYGSSASPSVVISSSTPDWVVDVCSTGTGITTSNQILEWLSNFTGSNADGRAGNTAQSIAFGASSVTMGYSVTSDYWGMVGADVIAFGNIGGSLPAPINIGQAVRRSYSY